MATELGKAYVQIVPSAKGIGQGLENALRDPSAQAGDKAGTQISQGISNKLNSMGKGMMKAGAIATAISVPIIKGIKSALSAYETQELAETKLTEIYRSRMGVGKKAAQATIDYASALQKVGVIGDEVALSGAQQLATFAKQPSTINKLLPAMNNLLAQQKGVNATSEDAVNIGNLMGKVLQGQTGALRRVGISFTDAQEQVLKYGTEEEKAAMLAEVINDNVGNMNETLADTPLGQMAQLKNSLGDIKESIGGALAPVLADVADYVSEKLVPALEKAVDFFKDHPNIAKFTVALAGILAIGGPFLMVLGSIVTIAPAVGAAFTVMMGPIGLVVAAIAALIAIGVLVWKKWGDKIGPKLSNAWEKIKKSAEQIFGWLYDYFKNTFERYETLFENAWKAISLIVEKAWKYIEFVITTYGKIINAVRNMNSSIRQKFIELAAKIVIPIVNAVGKIKSTFNSIKGAASSAVSSIVSKFQSLKSKVAKIFPISVGKIFKNMKLPHFDLKTISKDLGKLGKITVPTHVGVKWYAKGGIFDEPTIAGLGDVRGGEAALPLDPFWKRMDDMANSIVNGFATIAAAGGNGGDIKLDVYLYPSGPKMGEETVKAYDKYKRILG